MANILKSPHEAELMLQAEEYMNKGKYNFALYIIQVTVIYQYMLVKTNLFLPILPRYELYSSPRFTGNNITPVDKDILDIYTMLGKAVDRLALGEYYLRMQKVLENAEPHLSF